MSTKFYGNCENCGKNNLRTTITVHVHETPGTRRCGVVFGMYKSSGKGNRKKKEASIEFYQMANELEFNFQGSERILNNLIKAIEF